MEELITQLGLSDKEAKTYLFLLEEGRATAAEIAKKTLESRTNTYMILERLISDRLVETDETAKVRHFAATDPHNLQKLLLTRQQQLRQQQTALSSALPQLNSLFSLGQHRPGVVYLEGIGGFKNLLEDMAKTEGSIDLIASEYGPDSKEAWEVLQKGLAKRKARGITTRTIFNEAAKDWPNIQDFVKRGLDVRLWGKEPLQSEILIYGSKVALSVYSPLLITTVITNDMLATSFRTIFEQLWVGAETL